MNGIGLCAIFSRQGENGPLITLSFGKASQDQIEHFSLSRIAIHSP